MEQNEASGENLTRGWEMFSTSKEEISAMLTGLGEAVIEPEGITITDYPFSPSVAYSGALLRPGDIANVAVNTFPATIRIGDELVFIESRKKDQLLTFAIANRVRVLERIDVWGWILEPFLDTFYSQETHRKLEEQLEANGISKELVHSLREEVRIQMFKYNFDTTLWEWVHLGAPDVLCAMRTWYNGQAFADFYQRVMHVALMPERREADAGSSSHK